MSFSIGLALKSLKRRKASAVLTLVSLSIGVTLLLGIERGQEGIKNSFSSSVRGSDVILGARTGELQLLLYSIFHFGRPVANLSWKSFSVFRDDPMVRWAIPIYLGDSHRGFRVLGSDASLMKHYRYGKNKDLLKVKYGRDIQSPLDILIGADVAKELGYKPGKEIVLSHGSSQIDFQKHESHKFRVVGVLEKSGTPFDKTLIATLQSMEWIHSEDSTNEQPSSISAAIFGLKSKIDVFQFQEKARNYPHEALMAILPGLVLQDLWGLLSHLQKAFFFLASLFLLHVLLGSFLSLLHNLQQRRRELALFRSMGASRSFMLRLLLLENLLLSLSSIGLGFLIFHLFALILNPWVMAQVNFRFRLGFFNTQELIYLSVLLALSLLLTLIPAYKSYKKSLHEGLRQEQ